MDIGDHDNISFRETRVIALTPGVDVDDLALKLQHQAGVFDGCNLERTLGCFNGVSLGGEEPRTADNQNDHC